MRKFRKILLFTILSLLCCLSSREEEGIWVFPVQKIIHEYGKTSEKIRLGGKKPDGFMKQIVRVGIRVYVLLKFRTWNGMDLFLLSLGCFEFIHKGYLMSPPGGIYK